MIAEQPYCLQHVEIRCNILHRSIIWPEFVGILFSNDHFIKILMHLAG